MAETSVKYLHSELPGAPVLNGTAGSLIAVLDACLVTGWGLLTASSVTVSGGVATAAFSTSHAFEPDTILQVAGATPAGLNGQQRATSTTSNGVSWAAPGVADGVATGTITIKIAPAGWSKLFSGANVAAYRSGNPSSTQCVMWIDDTGSRTARLRGFESMTDVATGTGPFPTDVQMSGGYYVPKSNSADSSPRKWLIAASDRLVIVMPQNYNGYANDYGAWLFGDFISERAADAYNCIAYGSTSAGIGESSAGALDPLNWDSTTGVIARSYVQSGGPSPMRTRVPGAFTPNSGSAGNPVGPSVVNNAIYVAPVQVCESNPLVFRGMLPGLYHVPQFLGSGYDSKSKTVAVEGLVGRTLLGVRYASAGGRYMVDITGPWH